VETYFSNSLSTSRDIRFWLFLGLLYSFTLNTYAQSIQNTPYNTFDFEAIRSGGLFKDVTTDENGLLWVASDEGLISYDGSQAKWYPDLLSSNYIKAFLMRENGELWVLHDGGLNRLSYTAGKVESEVLIKGSVSPNDTLLHYPKAIYEDRNGMVWIGEDHAIVQFRNGQVARHSFPQLNNPANIYRTFQFAEDGFGTLWAAANSGELLYFDREKGIFHQADFPKSFTSISALTYIGEDRLWLGTDAGLFELRTTTERGVSLRAIPQAPRGISAILKNGREVYVATWEEGVYKALVGNSQAPLTFTHFDELHFSDVVNMHLNANGLWLCGNENVSLLGSTTFRVLPINNQTELIETATLGLNGEILVSEGQEVWELSSNFRGVEERLLHRSDNQYVKVPLRTQRGLWLGDAFGRVAFKDLKDEKMRYFGEQTYAYITDVFEDQAGNVWAAGSFGNGLMQISTDFKLQHFRGEGIDRVQVIKENEGGKLLAAGLTPNTVYHPQPDGKFQRFWLEVPQDTALRFTIEDMAFFRGKTVLATSHGLLETTSDWRSDTVTVQPIGMGRFSGEATNAVCFMPDGSCWAANNYGLLRIQNGQVLYFNRTNGLPSRVIKPRGLLVDFEGQLWISTARGMARLIPYAVVNQETRQPQLQSFKVNNRTLSIADADLEELPPAADLDLTFSTVKFTNAQLYYRYSLLNAAGDTLLNTISLLPSRPFFNLRAGTYELLVSAQQEAGHAWSKPYRLRFTIGQVWYRNPIWLSLIALGVIMLLYGIVRLYNWNLLKNNQRLDDLVRERTQALNLKQREVIEQQKQIIEQKNELLEKKQNLHKTQQALTTTELNFRKSKEEQLNSELEYRNKQLTTHTLHILQKSELLKELAQKIDKIIQQPEKSPAQDLKKIKKTIENNLNFEKDWGDFRLYFEQVHSDFYSKLKINYPNLTGQELKHCALIKLNLSNSECAAVLGISQESVKTSRFRLRKKIDLPDQQSLTEFLMSL